MKPSKDIEDIVKITEKWNKKGYLVERYYFDSNSKKVNLPVPKFIKENQTVVFWNHNDGIEIDYIKQTKQLTKQEFRLLSQEETK